MATPAPNTSPTAIDFDAVKVPDAEKTFKLSKAVTRHKKPGAEAPKGERAQLLEIKLHPLRWSDIADLRLSLDGLDMGDIMGVVARQTEEHPRTLDELCLPDIGRLNVYVQNSLVPILRLLFGQDGEPPEVHDGTAAVTVPIVTRNAKHGGDPLEAVELPVLKGAHIKGYPLDPNKLTYADAMDIVGRASGLPPSTLGKLRLEDTGNLVVALLGFLQGLHAT